MATEVLLMSDVKDVGAAGEVVRVSDGYARNYLMPRKLAAPVTEATRRRLVKLQSELQAKRALVLVEAQALAVRLAGVSCTIKAKAAKDKKLYGSVTVTEILAALKAQNFPLKKDQLHLDAPIKELGVFTVPVKLHADVPATLKVWVVEE